MLTRTIVRGPWRGAAVAVTGGVSLALAFPPAGLWPLAALGPALLVLAVSGRRPRAAFGLGAVFGLAFFGPLLWWLTNLGLLPWIGLVVVQALFVGVHGVLIRELLRLRWWPVAVAASWVAIEAVRGRFPLGGFPWGRLGFSQADAPSLPWASIGGVPLLSLLAALTGSALAWTLLSGARRRTGLVVVPVAGLAWMAGGALPAPAPSDRDLTIAVVQGNVPRGRTLAEQVRVRQVTQNHAEATLKLAEDVRAGRAAAPDLVVWPENSTDTDPRDNPAIAQTIRTAVQAIDRPVLIGAIVRQDGRMFNVGQLWLPDRGSVAEYAKRQLVPFGEYVPGRSLFRWVQQLQYIPRDFSPGDGDGTLDAGGIRIGDVICYEVAYDGLVRSSVNAGAALLVVQTNNATYMLDGQRGETLQQLDMARVRAVEHNRPAVVASTTGISAVVRPDGSIAAMTEPWAQQVLVERVNLRTTTSVWLSPWLELLAVLLVVAGLGAAVVDRRLRRADEPATLR
ncbi:apolipoprotein N-acyltransferase [Lentzea albidocapillata subsp. violacea]|uniref:Apolipoprotein N-acyltransferase n=1 Tax=Lentzea albidocapillata subsp. violacea TaxID=128104 RepID=A0A1G9S2N0_9PSEU|nr:apolipoprotein N-acyltransferase [Lentzea albidocapillata]SDM28995.1 apolipoprotein N-acyltransferase [Lentzea albidocapillata subsp. violacea]